MNVKNPTPRLLAFYAAAVSSFLIAGSALLFSVIDFTGSSWEFIFLLLLLSFVVTFLVFNFLLENFIYRKIKLIYKTIHTLKSTHKQGRKGLDLGEDIIGNVGKEVIEREQERSEEIANLKKLENYRQEFLSNVSHELKTPIFNIQGYVHTLLEGGIDDPEVNIHYLQRAAKSAERLCLIVEDLEEISRMESGDLHLDFRTFDIRELIADVFDSQELRGKELGIQFGFKEGMDTAMYVYADKEKIRQVLVNLVVNSLKYGRKGGSTLAGMYDMDENILVEITDTGIGIEAEHLPRLFERFYRVDKSRSREQGGTGLGLAIVKHIMESHNQTISVRSTPGVGTTFAFTLKKAH